jgi:RNA polymerase-binding transcription factor DksA
MKNMSLTRSQSNALKQLLDDRAVELEEKIRGTLPKPADETTLERTGLAQDEVDDATTSAEEHLNHTMHRHYVNEMRQIEIARERASSGLLDCCADCGEVIDYERLRAHPLAVRCLECQELHERRTGFVRHAVPLLRG